MKYPRALEFAAGAVRQRAYGPQMTAYTYILRCADGTFYAGSTRNLERRLLIHARGLGSDYPSCRLPFELVWFAEFNRIDEAFGLGKRIQGWTHAKRHAFIEGGFDAIKGWSARACSSRRPPKTERSEPKRMMFHVKRGRAFRLFAGAPRPMTGPRSVVERAQRAEACAVLLLGECGWALSERSGRSGRCFT